MALTLNKETLSVSYGVAGMTCASCAASLESYLNNHDGINRVSVNYPNQSVSLDYDPHIVNPGLIKETAKEIGYDILIEKENQDILDIAEKKKLAKLKSKLVFSAVLSIPVFVIAMFLMDSIPHQNWIMMLLSGPVLFWSGSAFFINAWRKARNFSTNMDTLVALSTGMAFGFSVFNTIYPEFFLGRGIEPHVYFESAVIIITLILLGKYLEERAKGKTSSAIKKLMGLRPKEVTVFRNGEERAIPIEDVIKNDLILVRPGEKIAVDGVVRYGKSFIDESMITGEAIPVKKSKGSEVFAGTINTKGSLKIIATKVGGDTLVSQIIRLVQEAQSSKPPIQKIVDKVAAVFVPIVISIAVIAFGIWYFLGPEPSISYAFLVFITILIIACPCALGLATPAALMVGIGQGAQQGILIKDARALEVAHNIDALIIDKTGTITEGRPRVTDTMWKDESTDNFFSEILLSIEIESEHPVADAIARYLKEKNIGTVDITEFQSITGQGAKAKFNGMWFYVGNESLMLNHNILIDSGLGEKARELSAQTNTVIYFANEHAVMGILAVADKIKSTSRPAIEELGTMGLELHMLTGDNQETAAAIARQTGITKYNSQLLPADKGEFIKDLQNQGKVVAMAGDGINDSHALAQSDLGIAMGSGTDIAMDSAGITLMHSDLQQIVKAIQLSKATVRTIHQNLFWAFVYNLIALPVAAGILYPIFGFLLSPMIAGATMAMSSVSVVYNSLRLKKTNL